MIITVTPNPAIDVTITLDRLEHGKTNRVEPASTRVGGKGINVARVLREQGKDVLAIAPVGRGQLAEVRADLGGIGSELLAVEPVTRRSVAIVERGDNRTTILNETGHALPSAVWDELVALVAGRIGEARCLVVSGSVPPATPDDLAARLVRIAVAASVPVIVDAVGAQLIGAAAAGATLLKPNRSELRETTGENDPVAGARALQRNGAGLVLVSLGDEGMIAVPQDPAEAIWFARLGRVLHGNPTGAGDAGVAAAASLLAAGITDPRAILARATAWSAAAVLEPLAGSVHHSHPQLEAELAVTLYG